MDPNGEFPAPVTFLGGGRPTTSRSLKIFIAEDNQDSAESLKIILELLGHEVRVAHDGLSALAVAAAEPPDLMLVDIGLPGIDGYELARRARSDARLARVPMVALTGYGTDEDRRRATAAGFDHHLVKPIDLDVLSGLVSRIAKTEAAPAWH
jgi:CheY-like chemotaxis protein